MIRNTGAGQFFPVSLFSSQFGAGQFVWRSIDAGQLVHGQLSVNPVSDGIWFKYAKYGNVYSKRLLLNSGLAEVCVWSMLLVYGLRLFDVIALTR